MKKESREEVFARQLDEQKTNIYSANYIQPKKTLLKFAIYELIVFGMQILIILGGIVLMSNFLHDENRLTHLIGMRTTSLSMWELVATVFIVFLITGFYTFLKRAFKNSNAFEEIIVDVLNEIPRVIYFFGSNTVACLLAIYGFKLVNPNLANSIEQTDAQILAMSGLFALEIFVIGLSLSFLMKRESHIL